MSDRLLVPRPGASEPPSSRVAHVPPVADSRLEDNAGLNRLARQRQLLDGSPRIAQLREQADRLNGRAEPAMRAKPGVSINADSALEREADVMAARAAEAPARRAPSLAARPAAVAGPIQRKVTIAGKKADEAAVQQFFDAQGVHYYYGYNAPLLKLINDGQARDLKDRNDALGLVELLAAGVESSKAQDGIQRKLIEISELFRKKEIGGATVPKEYDQWYRDMIVNGLCYGFVRLVEEHPDWTLAMWEALESWQPLHGVPPGRVLEHLNAHIEKHMRFGDGLAEQNFLEAVLLAREAWDYMKEQEEEDEDGEEDGAAVEDPHKKEEGEDGDDEDGAGKGYGPVPALIDSVTGTSSDHTSESVFEEADKMFPAVAKTAAERWKPIEQYIAGQVDGKSGAFHIIVWHTGHEMAVRCVLRDGRLEQLIAVETESEGIRNCRDWDQVGRILGPWLMTKGVTELGVDIKRQAPKK